MQCRELAESFTFEIPKFMNYVGNLPGGVSSPDFSFVGNDDEKYKG